MTTIREASQEETARVRAFYELTGYLAPVQQSDRMLIAESQDAIVGAVRLCHEVSVLVLRGMRVSDGLRRRQIGTHLLEAAADVLAGDTCYCVAHDYLEAFYAKAGFRKVPLRDVPDYLVERWRDYGSRGLNVIVMRREGVRSADLAADDAAA